MQQNATAAEGPPRTPLRSLQRSPGPLAGFKGEGRGKEEGEGRGGEGKLRTGAGREGGRGRERQERGRDGGEGIGEEVDSDAQLEQGTKMFELSGSGSTNLFSF